MNTTQVMTLINDGATIDGSYIVHPSFKNGKTQVKQDDLLGCIQQVFKRKNQPSQQQNKPTGGASPYLRNLR